MIRAARCYSRFWPRQFGSPIIMKEGISVLLLFTKTTSCDNCGYTFGVSVLLLSLPRQLPVITAGTPLKKGQSTVYVSSKLFLVYGV